MMSSDDGNPHGPVRDASRVGAELRAARLRLGLALPDVAGKLRIRLCFLEAIEDGRVAGLPMAGAYAGWHRFSGGMQPSSELVAPVPDRLAPLAERGAPDPPPPAIAVLPGPSTSALAAPAPSLASPSQPPSMASPAAVAPTPVSRPPAENRVVLRQVKERQGQVLLNRVMRAGDAWTVPKGTQLVLSTGNAGGTELLLDGQAIPAFGAPAASGTT